MSMLDVEKSGSSAAGSATEDTSLMCVYEKLSRTFYVFVPS